MEILFGIDLGTTYSCVAYVNENEKAETIKNAEGMMTTPSVIYFDSKDSQIVGEEAKSYAVSEPEKSVAFIKREMGTDYRRELFGEKYSPQELSAKILTKLMQDANNTLMEQGVISEGNEVKKAVITCPAYFGMAEKDATKTAGELAGIEVLDIINEPTAAAIHYGQINGDKGSKRVLVYDLGGGTFDVTIMDIDGDSIDVVCTGGDSELGGKDWDEATVKYLLEKWQDENDSSEDITMNLETKSNMLSAAEKAKKTLTAKEEAKVNFVHDGETFRTVLTRSDFDEYTSGLLNKTLQMADKCIEDMNRKDAGKKIDEIILVGGSSRMPQIKAKIEEKYGLPVHMFDPDEAVAKGAAIYAQNANAYKITIDEISKATGKTADQVEAEIIQGGDLDKAAEEAGVSLDSSGVTAKKLRINNVSSRTYGLLCEDGAGRQIISNIIYQNDKLPATKSQTFTNLDENGACLELYETIASDDIVDQDEVRKHKPVISFDMVFLKPTRIGTQINVEMTLNNNGLLLINAEEMMNHTKLNCKYEITGGMSKDELKLAKARTDNSKVE